ncbi:hypothetical protein HO133_005005 [Letharia lupina]|uniref:Elongation of fatty acids protein n=1 Tax=Letharia lupina TaxID=560253 RepID=A0A8H6C8Y0_9LECA|nr:uncharacterized protein HO133_005005 [Letharia lupina]KAF6219180.1 hypothetical protein HO133_005005 [Letharia lupina]
MSEGSVPYPYGSLPSGSLQAAPWVLFDRMWTAATGYAPTSFLFIPGKTPMSTAKETAVGIAVYYLMIFFGRRAMKGRPAFELTSLFLLHNLFLSLLSGFVLLLFVEELGPGLWKHGMHHAICGSGGWTKRLVTLYYVNYLIKYYELIDTAFLILKKKPTTFLHCYHHGATVLLCYTQLAGQTSVSWVPITLNLTVHVLMYWYYFQSARGIRVPWKEWITRLQILQFLIDLAFVYFASYSRAVVRYFPRMPHAGDCAGTGFAAAMGCGILTSYLALFVSFYLVTYHRVAASTRLKRTTGAEAVVRDVKRQFVRV